MKTNLFIADGSTQNRALYEAAISVHRDGGFQLDVGSLAVSCVLGHRARSSKYFSQDQSNPGQVQWSYLMICGRCGDTRITKAHFY